MPSHFRHPFLDLARERVVILDGGMGTSLHKYRPTDKDWGYAPNGKSLLNLSDALVYTKPEWISEIHRGFFAAGCDGVETNTFNATQLGSASSAWRQARRDQPAEHPAREGRSPRSSPPPTARASLVEASARARRCRPHRPGHLRRLRRARGRVPAAARGS
jgi:hypothetical protein